MSFLIRTENGVTFYQSTVLPCPHAFATRLGGVSAPVHLRSMNLGENRGDDPSSVAENTRLICRAAHLPETVVSAAQIHSATVLYAPAAFDGKPSCDGFCTDRPGISLMVKTADCVPILLYDRKTNAAAAVHAGWRGSAAGIAAVGVEKLVSLGASPSDITAALGPSIRSCCFEVKEDFIAEFTALAGSDAASRYIFTRQNARFADLQGLNREILLSCGILAEHLDVSPLCTCCRPQLFFSHRATGGVRGTMGALIAPVQP